MPHSIIIALCCKVPSFEDIRTYKGNTYSSSKEPAIKSSLLLDDLK